MGKLKVDRINLNDASVVEKLKNIIDQLVRISLSYYPLRFKPQYYFEISNRQLPSERGWYVVLDGRKPLYTGKADNLNVRLNTNNGSIDNFANRKRVSDSERNFIKKFDELRIIGNLRICIVREADLCLRLNTNADDLTDLDRGNIEKTINIFRTCFNYLT